MKYLVYNLDGLLFLTDFERIKRTSSFLYIDDIELLKDNFYIIETLAKFKPKFLFYSKDIEILRYIENKINFKGCVTLSMLDDYLNMDRSYIDSREFEKTKLEIPISYLMWNPNISDKQNISVLTSKTNLLPITERYYDSISKDDLKIIKDIVLNFCEKYKDYDDVEKTIIVSNYIQNKVQYINLSRRLFKKNVVDEKTAANPKNIFIKGFGICISIACATNFLLNNELFNVNSRISASDEHAWNIVEIDGKYYYIDNTFNITRGKNRYDNALKAKSFNDEYLLFGENKDAFHNFINFQKDVESKEYSRILINNKVKKLSKVINFKNYDRPVFEHNGKIV